jgi:hypothetical protein
MRFAFAIETAISWPKFLDSGIKRELQNLLQISPKSGFSTGSSGDVVQNEALSTNG